MRQSIPKKLERFVATTLLLAILISLTSGCGSTRTNISSESSVGQQLLDLQKAHEQGVISDKEYEKLKRNIVRKND